MRKLMWFAIGFAAACGLCAYVLPTQTLNVFAAVFGSTAFFLAVFGRKFPLYRRAALVFFGCTLGLCWYVAFRSRYLTVPAALDGKTYIVTIRTADYSEDTSYGVSVEGTLQREGRTYQVRVYLDQTETLEPGILLNGPFHFSATSPQEDPVSYLSGDGIFLIARQEDALSVSHDPETTWQDRIAHLRQWLRSAIHACFPPDAEPFARALLLGDSSLLDYKTDTDFKISGIRHVIAVSGLHVSILVALLGAVTFRKKYLMVPVGIGVLTMFAALAGFTPSVTRACIMSGLLLLALLFNREYDGATALSFAVLVMLVCNPLVIASVSFQLSVASVAGIYLFNPKILPWLISLFPDPGGRKGRQRLIRGFGTSVSITLSAMTLTTPLCACYFGMVSLVGVMTNLLALWIISGIFYGIIAVCLLYSVWVPAAAFLRSLVEWPIRYVLGVAHVMADLPLAAVYTESRYIVFWLVFVYLLLFVFAFSGRRKVKQLLCSAILGLCVALLVSWIKTEDTRITILDVGQGQCILLENEGRIYMVDCGGDADAQTADLAAAHLLSRGINHLDGLILTHLDRDHAGGAEYLLSRIDVELLVLPEVHSELSAKRTVYASENLQLEAENTKLTIYAPTFPGTGNEMSLCVLFDTEKCDILITGDRDAFGERMLLRSDRIPDVDILIAGHHGSKNSTSE